jgi:predicted nucleic acid-binding protein
VKVVDASTALKWVLNERGRDEALEILDEHESGRVRLIAPALLLEEAASALSKRCRRGELTILQSRKAFEFLEERSPELIGAPDLLGPALRLSLEHRISFLGLCLPGVGHGTRMPVDYV